jgi:hypothetical protein
MLALAAEDDTPSPSDAAPPSGDPQGAASASPKHDFGHTLATVDVLPKSAAQPAAANSADSLQCEEQDLNLHTLRYRNPNPEITLTFLADLGGPGASPVCLQKFLMD